MLNDQVKPWVKTSLAPGSGVVTKYLLQRYLLVSVKKNDYYEIAFTFPMDIRT